MNTQHHNVFEASRWTRPAAALALLVCRAGLAQDFQPFGEVGGQVRVVAEYGGGDRMGVLSETAEFESGRSGSLSQDGASTGVLGGAAWANWSSDADSHEIEAAPFTEAEAHEWSFRMGGSGQRDFTSSARATVSFELLEPVRVVVRARGGGAFYTARLGEFEAAGSPDPSALSGRGGTLGPDGLMFREFTLEPGEHSLTVEVSPAQHSGTWEDADGELWLRFEPARCAADMNRDGVLDLDDINRFVGMFLAGCG